MKRLAKPGFTAGFIACAVILAWSMHGALILGTRREMRATTPAPVPALLERGFTEVEASLHLHTRASWDGAGSYHALRKAARDLGIAVLMVSEHNNTAAWEEAGEHDGVLVVPGVEVGLPQGHALVWGLERNALDRALALPEAVRGAVIDSLVLAQGGVMVVAHPRGVKHDWKGGLPSSARSLEIVNGDAAWRDERATDLLRALFFYPFDGRLALASLVDRPSSSLAWWDSLLGDDMVFGTVGLDAHGGVPLGRRMSIPVPSYHAVLGLARQHLLVRAGGASHPAMMERAVLEAIASGHHYSAFDAFAPADGFSFWAECGGRTAIPGETIAITPDAMLRARIPEEPPVLVRLFRDGVLAEETAAWEMEARITEPGCYRLEVYQRRNGPFGGTTELPWIFSNAIRIEGETRD